VEADVFFRICRAAVLTAACVLGAVRVVVVAVSSGVLIGLVAVASIVGVLVTTHVQHPSAARMGATAAAATSAVLLMMIGVVGLLDTTAALVVPLLLAGAGAWAWRRRSAWRDYAAAARRGPAPSPQPAITVIEALQPPPVAPAIVPADLSVRGLCLACHRSYWLLHDLPAGPALRDLVGVRERLLDELEQRDPAGFHRWLHAGARASSDPGRYLTENRTGTDHDRSTPRP
jgi:hypothetical protein